MSVLWTKASDYLFDICWPLHCLFFELRLLITHLIYFGQLYCLFFELRLLITHLIYFGHYIVCPLYYASDYPFNILWPLYCLSFELRLLITHFIYFGHCIVCPSNYGFWLPIWYTVAIVLSVLWFTASYYSFGILWPLHCLSFKLRLLITHLIYVGHCIVCPLNYGFWLPIWYTLTILLSVLWITASDYPFDILWPLYYLSFELRFWLPLWYLQTILNSR